MQTILKTDALAFALWCEANREDILQRAGFHREVTSKSDTAIFTTHARAMWRKQKLFTVADFHIKAQRTLALVTAFAGGK